jgi:hypothetical protein
MRQVVLVVGDGNHTGGGSCGGSQCSGSCTSGLLSLLNRALVEAAAVGYSQLPGTVHDAIV